MRIFNRQLLLLATALAPLAGCKPHEPETVAQGVIWYLEYKLEDGKTATGGFTRMNDPRAVPAGNGSWNVDAYGRLTRDYLIVTFPQRKDLGPRIIPAHRLVDIQFGDGGVKNVDENRPASPKQ